MNIVIDNLNNTVVGSDLSPNSLQCTIEVDNDFDITKVIQLNKGSIQKTDASGNPLYLKNVYTYTDNYVVVGQDETIEDTGSPVMEKVQKTDIEGNLLYLEPVDNDFAEVTTPIDESGNPLPPVIIEQQKKSLGGKLLYWKDILENQPIATLDHTEETTESEGNEPIILPITEPRVVTLSKNPESFTSDEILNEKYKRMLKVCGRSHIVADEFLTEDDIDLTEPKLANTGVKLVQFLANGELTLKPIDLEVPTKTVHICQLQADNDIKLLVNGVEAVGDAYSFDTAIENIVIKFINTSDSPKMLKSYALCYDEEV